MRKKWIKLFPLLIGAVIAYCLLWYVIPQNKGGEVAAILVAAILLFFFILLRFVSKLPILGYPLLDGRQSAPV